MQSSENTQKSVVKRKRIRHLIPELRCRVPDMFDPMSAERVAEQLGVRTANHRVRAQISGTSRAAYSNARSRGNTGRKAILPST
jgi:hypothetical protein